MKIIVTGMGAISSIGHTVDGNLASLKNGKDGITQIECLDNLRKPFVGGEIKLSNDDLKKHLTISFSGNIQRSTLLGLVAAKEAWGKRAHSKKIRTGIIFGTTIGGITINDQLVHDQKNLPIENRNYKSLHDNYFGTDFIASQIGIDGYKATISTACSTAANSILLGARLIRANKLDRVLVGGAESITNYTLNGFDSLMLYDKEKCRPFDENRNGLNLGEAGSFLVIESEKSALENKQEKIAELIGWGNACDAYHQTASSPEGKGAILAINEALKIANITTDEIDYINAHGTGTPNNDLTESTVLQSIFGNKIPPFSSTKSFTGHTLAAAGGIEAIYSILAIQNNLIFPNLNFSERISGFDFEPEKKLISNKKIKTVLSNSFGFGGNCTELIFTE